MHSLFNSTIQILVDLINQIGYFGIFIGMFVESTIIPVPSELIMIPAGIASAKGEMNIYIATIAGISGNVLGAIFSYYLAASLGRQIIFRVGKYFFVKAETVIKIENYFNSHGPISVFISRLLPGFRHFISLPAGIAKMDMRLFFFYTLAGSTIWTSVLSWLGYIIGDNQELIAEHLSTIAVICLVSCVAIVVTYFFCKRSAAKKLAS